MIDFDQLRQELSGSIVEGPQERYRLDWPGKREALLAANAPIAKTLRPCREESVDFDTTKNLFIEGDNLEALKLLQETYLGKVKLVFIDPPYNTGNDFLYEDDFSQHSESYLEKSNQKDDKGSKLVHNQETNGRFHSDWLSMVFSRLKLARNLLRDDGVIFITIDDSEFANLSRICEEIFGGENFVAAISWQKKYSVSNNSKGVASVRDFVLVFSKTPSFENGLFPKTEEAIARYQNPDNDPRGPWKPVDYWNVATPEARPNLVYSIKNPSTGSEVYPEKKAWKYSKEIHLKHVEEQRIWWGLNGKNTVPALKLFLSDVRDGLIPDNWWPHEKAGHTDGAKKELDELFGGDSPFDTPKPLRLLSRIFKVAAIRDSDIILDFFAGSGTTAHAVLEFNQSENFNCRFILVQLPEVCGEGSVARKSGFSTIADITKERIRRAGSKILEKSPLTTSSADIGFRVLKIDASNMEPVFYTPNDVKQESLLAHIDNIRPGRTSEDLLFQVLLDWGVDLALPIQRETLAGKEVFFVDETALAACFEGGIEEEFVKALAKRKPLRVVFRDAGFADDAVKINVGEIFKSLSPETEVKVI